MLCFTGWEEVRFRVGLSAPATQFPARRKIIIDNIAPHPNLSFDSLSREIWTHQSHQWEKTDTVRTVQKLTTRTANVDILQIQLHKWNPSLKMCNCCFDAHTVVQNWSQYSLWPYIQDYIPLPVCTSVCLRSATHIFPVIWDPMWESKALPKDTQRLKTPRTHTRMAAQRLKDHSKARRCVFPRSISWHVSSPPGKLGISSCFI